MSHAAHGDEFNVLKFQYEDMDQQNDSYIVGMWTFLVTEVMFFGMLFLTYSLYRANYQNDWFTAHEQLDWKLGGINTANLLFSSFLMATAVRQAQLKDRKGVLLRLAGVLACAFGFLVIKYVEYSGKYEHHLFPGPGFAPDVTHFHGANLDHVQLFFGLYFAMTGLHGVHVLVGILVIGALAMMWFKGKKIVTEDYVPTELVGLYWHFVDIVWIFLYPLFYLMPNPSVGSGGGNH
jgi:cytochrome c oxidase subunit 3